MCVCVVVAYHTTYMPDPRLSHTALCWHCSHDAKAKAKVNWSQSLRGASHELFVVWLCVCVCVCGVCVADYGLAWSNWKCYAAHVAQAAAEQAQRDTRAAGTRLRGAQRGLSQLDNSISITLSISNRNRISIEFTYVYSTFNAIPNWLSHRSVWNHKSGAQWWQFFWSRPKICR